MRNWLCCVPLAFPVVECLTTSGYFVAFSYFVYCYISVLLYIPIEVWFCFMGVIALADNIKGKVPVLN
jgi:hypothetical protein